MKRHHSFLLFLLFCLPATCLYSAPIEFTARLISVAPNTPPAEIMVETTPGNGISVKVTPFTEIKDTDGDAILLSDLSPADSTDSEDSGDFLKIEARLTETGTWIADEIEQVQDKDSEFELRGIVQSAEQSSITVNEITMQLEGDVSIRDEFGEPLTVNAFIDRVVSNPPVVVSVEGYFDESNLLATSIKIQTNFLKITLLGAVLELTEEEILLDTGAEPKIPVALSENTRIHGDLLVGVTVKVIGYLDSGHMVQARIINVKKLFELAPDELEMGFHESKRVNVTLSRTLESDLSLEVCSNEDNSVAIVSSSTPIIVSAGELTGSFEVGSFDVEGETEITLCTAEGESQTLEVEVNGENEGSNEDEHELELKWTPRIIKVAPNGSRVVRILLKYGVAAEELSVDLTRVPEDLGVVLPEVTIPAGKNSVSVALEFTDPKAAGTIIATLASYPDTESAELEIELKAGKPDEEDVEPEEEKEDGGPPETTPGNSDGNGPPDENEDDPPGHDDEDGDSGENPGKGNKDEKPGKGEGPPDYEEEEDDEEDEEEEEESAGTGEGP